MLSCREFQTSESGNQITQIKDFCTTCCRWIGTFMLKLLTNLQSPPQKIQDISTQCTIKKTRTQPICLPFGLLRFLSACLSGRQTGQSVRVQCFQCEMICRDEEQCGTEHDLPAWHVVMWFKTFFIVLQCGSVHWNKNNGNVKKISTLNWTPKCHPCPRPPSPQMAPTNTMLSGMLIQSSTLYNTSLHISLLNSIFSQYVLCGSFITYFNPRCNPSLS